MNQACPNPTKTLVLAAALASVPCAVRAQEPTRPLPMREIVVSATRSETELRQVPVHVTVITRDQLDLSAAQNLEDLLLEIPGIGLQRNVRSGSAHPSWQAVSLRGLGGTAASRTLVLVDGVPLNDGFFGWVRWDQVPVETIERIEIVRGGGSTAWGGQGLAGVIQVITRDPRAAGLSVGLEGGSQSTVRGDALGTFGNARLSGFVSGEYFDTDGYILTAPEQRGAVDVPSSSDHVALRGKVSWEASESVRLVATGSYYDEDKINSSVLQPNTTESGFGQVGVRIQRPGGARLEANLFRQAQTYMNAVSSPSEDRSTETPSLSQFDVPSDAWGGNVQWSPAPLGAHDLTAGLDVDRIHGEAFEDYLYQNGAFQNRRNAGGDQLLTGVYLQDRVRLSDRVELAGGVRLDMWRNTNGFRRISEISSGDVSTDVTFEDRSEVRLSENAGVFVDVSERVSLRGSVYTGLRVPVLNELYKPFRSGGGIVTEANPMLDPERLFGFEAGIDYAVGRRWLARATAFYNRVTDAILDATIMQVDQSQVVDPCGFIPAGGSCRQRMNVGTIRSVGIETQVEFHPAGAWLVAGSFDFTPSEITEAQGREEVVGSRPPRTVRTQGTIRAGHTDSRTLEAVVVGRYIGSQFENDINTDRIGDSFVVDVRVARDIVPSLTAYATVQNLFDTSWQISNEPILTRLGTPRYFVGGLRARLAGVPR